MLWTRGDAASARLTLLFYVSHFALSNQHPTQEISVPTLEQGPGQAQDNVNGPLGEVSTVETPTYCPSTIKLVLVAETHRIGVEALQTFLIIGHQRARNDVIWMEIFHFLSFGSNFTLDNSTNTHKGCESTDVLGHLAAAGVSAADRRSSYFCPCSCSAEVSIVLRGKLCCWEVHSNWIVDKTSLSSALALLLMQVNNHLNGSCLCGDWKTGGKKERAAGVQHLNVNNLLFNACPAFRESETC